MTSHTGWKNYQKRTNIWPGEHSHQLSSPKKSRHYVIHWVQTIKLVFSPGIVTGTSAPTAARISVGAKSPLTGGIKESNAGSAWGADLAELNVRALILEGQPKAKKEFWGLYITWDKAAHKPKVEFFDATEYTNKPLMDVFPKIYERYGKINFNRWLWHSR